MSVCSRCGPCKRLARQAHQNEFSCFLFNKNVLNKNAFASKLGTAAAKAKAATVACGDSAIAAAAGLSKKGDGYVLLFVACCVAAAQERRLEACDVILQFTTLHKVRTTTHLQRLQHCADAVGVALV